MRQLLILTILLSLGTRSIASEPVIVQVKSSSHKLERSTTNADHQNIISIAKQAVKLTKTPSQSISKKPRPRLIGFLLLVLAFPLLALGLIIIFLSSIIWIIVGILLFAFAIFLLVKGLRKIFKEE
ncbi:hypothetical protein K6119_02550 [Paracrocinitomix mangrovi]|uniref:type IV secretion system protein n=1 Tax=Paracrocinitomix mangrovi TaxID=2862509 RepID=UPI001C8CF5BE|nr:type IV secretion system protein [Paracrocinitomix mangrovi]UKN02399.1 hypothetical protein K6119_02550 [Paracrocinitomix mangrovi]